jgi:hypothetical protein
MAENYGFQYDHQTKRRFQTSKHEEIRWGNRGPVVSAYGQDPFRYAKGATSSDFGKPLGTRHYSPLFNVLTFWPSSPPKRAPFQELEFDMFLLRRLSFLNHFRLPNDLMVEEDTVSSL